MTLYKFNDHNVEVDEALGFKVVNNQTGYAGAYDFMLYKDFEICTFEREVDEEFYGGEYTAMNADGEEFTAQTLAELKALIDNL